MHRRKDNTLTVADGVSINAWLDNRGRKFKGFLVSDRVVSRGCVALTIRGPFRYFRFRSGIKETGWWVSRQKSSLNENELINIEVLLIGDKEEVLAKNEQVLRDEAIQVCLPEAHMHCREKVQELKIYFNKFKIKKGWFDFLTPFASSDLRFAVFEALDRGQLKKYLFGDGIELGPGHNPFLKPTKQLRVKYLEQSPPEKWGDLYASNGSYTVDKELWNHYIIGEAHALPVNNESLDFIFSSHVFEHLYNPLGHLTHWHGKLKAGGVVVCVIPAIEGCKDYVAPPCEVETLVKEFNHKNFEPELYQYEKYVEYRGLSETGAELMERKRSIHVHFYTLENIKKVAEWAQQNIGFSRFEIDYKVNHKDFYLLLWK
jgi:hypothetical protein